MTNGQSLFGIDPTEGFIEYVKTVKPYHTKLLDVLVEYVYAEKVSALVTEKWSWRYDFKRPDTDTEYACGYGYRWDASSVDAPGSMSSFSIKQAFTNTPGPNANSFLVEFNAQPKYSIVVTDTRSNELAFASRFAVIGVNPAAKTFTVAGDITGSDFFTYDEHLYITENTSSSVNGKYTYISATFNGTNTIVTVAEPVSLIATVSGFVNIVVPFSDIPFWPSGTSVKLTSNGVVPVPLNEDTTYHFIPSTRIGFFTLADRRYPQQFEQFIDLTSLGTGILEIERTEPFVPGDPIMVYNSAGAFNDGYYIIADMVKEGNDFRIRVLQTVYKNSPFGVTYDGAMTLDKRSYDFPSYCPLTRSSDARAHTFIHEDLKFTFSLSFKNDVGTTLVENQDLSLDVGEFRTLTTYAPAESIQWGFGTPVYDLSDWDPAPMRAPRQGLTQWDNSFNIRGYVVSEINPQIASVVYAYQPTLGFAENPGARGNLVRKTGKAYFELVLNSGGRMWAGIRTWTPFDPLDPYGDGAWPDTGTIAVFWTPLNQMYVVSDGNYPVLVPGVSWSGDTLQLAVDIDAGTLQVGVNNVWGTVMSIPSIIGKQITPAMISPDQSEIPMRVELRTSEYQFTGTMPPGYTAFDVGAVPGDEPPVVAPITIFFPENSLTSAALGTVVATDDGAITDFRFATTTTDVSADGLFTISDSGVVSLTAAGAASAFNDYEVASATTEAQVLNDALIGAAGSSLVAHVANSGHTWSENSSVQLFAADGLNGLRGVNNSVAYAYSSAILTADSYVACTFAKPTTSNTSAWRVLVGAYDVAGAAPSVRAGLFFVNGSDTKLNIYRADGSFTTLATYIGSPSSIPATNTLRIQNNKVIFNGVVYATTDILPAGHAAALQMYGTSASQTDRPRFTSIQSGDITVGSTSKVYSVQAKDASGTWSDPEDITMTLTNVIEPGEFVDNFTGAAGPLTGHLSEGGTAWQLTGSNSWQLNGSGSIVNTSGATVACENVFSVASSSVVVEADMTMTTPGFGGAQVQMYLADSPDWNNYVGVYVESTSGGLIRAFLDANSPTIGESTAWTNLAAVPGTQFTIRLEYSSTQIVLKVNGFTAITLPYGGTIDLTGAKLDMFGNVAANYSISRLAIYG